MAVLLGAQYVPPQPSQACLATSLCGKSMTHHGAGSPSTQVTLGPSTEGFWGLETDCNLPASSPSPPAPQPGAAPPAWWG